MAKYLIDTNHLTAAINDDQGFWKRLHDLHVRGNRVRTCTPVLCEYEIGLVRTKLEVQNRRVLRRLLKIVKVWPLEPNIVPIYSDVFFELKRKGRVLSQVDIMLAAMARCMNAIIVTADRDFEALSDLKCENWLASS